MRRSDPFGLFVMGIVLSALPLVCWLFLVSGSGAEHPSAGDMAKPATIHDYNAQVAAELQASGTKAAMDLLERFTQQDPSAFREQHAMVHELGKANFAYHGEPVKALAACDTRFWSGCFHGTLQAYFGTLEKVEASHMNVICPVKSGESPTHFLRYNCLHGAGHGLAIRFNYDILKSLAHCDLLNGSEWDRSSCYGGVFMENIVSFQQAHHHEGKGGFITHADLHYPCNAVALKYAGSCWMIQTSAMLTLTAQSWPTLFRECERAGEFRETCLESVGRDASGMTQRNQLQIVGICRQGTEAQRPACERGAVKDIVFNDAKAEPGFEFCESHATDRTECRRVVSQAARSLTP